MCGTADSLILTQYVWYSWHTLASYYRDYTKILSKVIRGAKITENDQLIVNSHNKVKTTWGIINKEWKK